MQFQQALATGVLLASLGASPAVCDTRAPDWTLDASAVPVGPVAGQWIDPRHLPQDDGALLITLDYPQQASRFSRSGPQAAIALGSATSLFVRSQKYKHDASEAPRGLGAARGKTYSLGLAVRW